MPIDQLLKQIPDLDQSKMPAVDPQQAARLFDDLLAGGGSNIVALVDALQETDDGTDYRVRFCLHNLAKVVAGEGRSAQRDVFVRTLVSQLGGERPAAIQTFLVQQLQWIGGKSELRPLAALLEHADGQLFDAALAAMVVNGSDAEPLLRKALGSASPTRRGAIENALTQIG